MKKQEPAAMITGLVGPEKKGGWSVQWVADGACPQPIAAATLTEAVDGAAAAAAEFYARHNPIPGAELQLAIYPWKYKRGPMFDIDGQAGAFTARDIQGSDLQIAGPTLEDLVEAVRHMTNIRQGDSMFRWIRQIASLG